MKPNLLIKRLSFLSTPARLGLTLVLVAAMLATTAPPASAAALGETISAGYFHACGVRPDGSLDCWGRDDYGQVSGPNGSSDTFTLVSAGYYHTCGLKTDGSLACWGDDTSGQVSGPNGSSEVLIQVSVGLFHTCGLKTDGSLVCWGYNSHGQVSSPNASSDIFTQVSAGYRHTCGVKTDGSLICWGRNYSGSVTGPNGSSDTFTQVSASSQQTCGLKTDGSLACWGINTYGQVSGPNGSSDTFIQVNINDRHHTCGVKTDGSLACWGYDYAGSVTGPNASTDTFAQVSAGLYYTCAQKTSDGTAVCWGDNSNGKASPPGGVFTFPPFISLPPLLDLDADDSGGEIGTDFAATFTEDGGAVAIADSDLSLTDADDTNLESATVTITNPQDGADEALAANTTGTSIAASYNSDTGVLSLTGTDTVANYQQVLRTVTYDNASQDPNTTVRSVTFVANDGEGDSNIAISTVAVNAVNDPPTATNSTVSAFGGTDKVFAAGDFNFADVDAGDTLSQIQITSLESAGVLYLDGDGDGVIDSGEDVTLNQVIAAADISKLKFKPEANASGSPYATFGFKVHDGTAYSTSAYVMSINASSDLGRTYLPFILSGPALGPDLVVESLVATSDAVTVIIKNQGNSAVVDAFWVDVYINPDPPPTRVNQIWSDLASQGLAWGVTDSIPAGNTLTLTIGDKYYRSDLSNFSMLTPGTPVYAQADSISDNNITHGAVLETHEMNGGTYNNISAGISTAGVTGVDVPAVGRGKSSSMEGLPSRH